MPLLYIYVLDYCRLSRCRQRLASQDVALRLPSGRRAEHQVSSTKRARKQASLHFQSRPASNPRLLFPSFSFYHSSAPEFYCAVIYIQCTLPNEHHSSNGAADCASESLVCVRGGKTRQKPGSVRSACERDAFFDWRHCNQCALTRLRRSLQARPMEMRRDASNEIAERRERKKRQLALQSDR